METYVLTECVISLVVLVWVCYFQFKRLGRDDFRSDIRRLRDELFDFMWENRHDFNDPAYREMRRVLNGLLKLSNHVNPVNFLCVAVQGAIAMRRGAPHGDPVPRTQNTELQRQIDRIRRAATERFMDFVFREGPRGLVVRLCLIYPSRVIRWLARFKDRMHRDGQDLLVRQGHLYGSPNLSSTKAAAFG